LGDTCTKGDEIIVAVCTPYLKGSCIFVNIVLGQGVEVAVVEDDLLNVGMIGTMRLSFGGIMGVAMTNSGWRR
jgi:hypothetical protein